MKNVHLLKMSVLEQIGVFSFFFLEINFVLNTIPRATLCKILIFYAFPISQKRLDRILYTTHHITLDPSKGLFTWRWGTPSR